MANINFAAIYTKVDENNEKLKDSFIHLVRVLLTQEISKAALTSKDNNVFLAQVREMSTQPNLNLLESISDFSGKNSSNSLDNFNDFVRSFAEIKTSTAGDTNAYIKCFIDKEKHPGNFYEVSIPCELEGDKISFLDNMVKKISTVGIFVDNEQIVEVVKSSKHHKIITNLSAAEGGWYPAYKDMISNLSENQKNAIEQSISDSTTKSVKAQAEKNITRIMSSDTQNQVEVAKKTRKQGDNFKIRFGDTEFYLNINNSRGEISKPTLKDLSVKIADVVLSQGQYFLRFINENTCKEFESAVGKQTKSKNLLDVYKVANTIRNNNQQSIFNQNFEIVTKSVKLSDGFLNEINSISKELDHNGLSLKSIKLDDGLTAKVWKNGDNLLMVVGKDGKSIALTPINFNSDVTKNFVTMHTKKTNSHELNNLITASINQSQLKDYAVANKKTITESNIKSTENSFIVKNVSPNFVEKYNLLLQNLKDNGKNPAVQKEVIFAHNSPNAIIRLKKDGAIVITNGFKVKSQFGKESIIHQPIELRLLGDGSLEIMKNKNAEGKLTSIRVGEFLKENLRKTDLSNDFRKVSDEVLDLIYDAVAHTKEFSEKQVVAASTTSFNDEQENKGFEYGD